MTQRNHVWIEAALSRPAQRITVRVGQGQVACSVWFQNTGLERPGVLLIHGNGASRDWWDAVAPGIREASRVVALDLSGHGDSRWLPEYEFDDWMDDVLAVMDEFFGSKPVILVGHSMGGLISLLTAWRHAERVSQIIALDTPLRKYTPEQLAKRRGISTRPMRRYQDRTEALKSFKTVPETLDAPALLWSHIAERSFFCDSEEYVRKLDPKIYARQTKREVFLRAWPEGTILIRAQYGLIDSPMADEIARCLGPTGVMRTMPEVGHNLLLEEPAALAMMIDSAIVRGSNCPLGNSAVDNYSN